ncbi:MAG: DUF192 domain-containing protein [Candidatus Micrarchaeota archaeon]
MRIAALLAIALLLLGCLGEGNGDWGGEPDTAKVQLPDGKIVDCEIRDTQAGREEGLMGHDSLCGSCGMLFVFESPGRHGFWMKSMKFPIDIVFIDEGWKVVGIAQDVLPCLGEPCTTYYPDSNAMYVLELPANATSGHGIGVGSGITRLG